MSDQYDLVILGAGPGGYVSAIRASQLNLKVAIIEKNKPGGVCLNIGCMPSKSLIHQAKIYGSISNIEQMGIKVDKTGFDYSKIYLKSRKVADTLSKGVQFLLKKNKIDLIIGEGIITGDHEITVNNKKVTGKNIIIATGSKPKELTGFPFDEKTVLSSTGALMLQSLPERLLILGAGAIGVEFAYIMHTFGVEVYLVEALDHILPLEDEEIANVVRRSFIKKGIKILTSTKALSIKKKENAVEVTLDENNGSQTNIEVNNILVAVGRVPNTENIGLENIDIQTEKSFIPVGDYYQTKVSGVYAVGEVIDTPMLAHVASKEGETVIEHIAKLNPVAKLDLLTIPAGIYCEPQVASFGITEEKAKEKSIPYEKAVFPFRAVGKSIAIEHPEGMVKVIFSSETKEILGTHIVGADATELIHEILLAKSAELLPADIANMMHAHPTLSEAVMEAMRGVEGWAIHA